MINRKIPINEDIKSEEIMIIWEDLDYFCFKILETV